MEKKYLLKKDHLIAFLRRIARDHRIIAPVRNRHGDTLFTPLTDLDRQQLDLENQPQNSIKPFLFPQHEVIGRYDCPEPGKYVFSAAEDNFPPTVFFGVRSCDLSAILYLDVIFLRESRDPGYQQKRRRSLLVGLNCNDPFENCFCNATKNGPFLEFGSDLQLTDLGKTLLVEPGRAAGQALVDQWRQFFSTAGPKDSQRRYQAFLEARGGFKCLAHVEQAINRLKNNQVDESVWEFLSARCQDCGGCAYICPTCSCFTINDHPLSEQHGERIRSWDACTFSGFTRMAGDHNPVDREVDAIRQRFKHKLLFDVNRHGRPSCVGCGRCVGICFGGTDIVRFINLLNP